MNDPLIWELEQAAYLHRLRAEFPDFGIVADFRRPIWIAVRGRYLFVKADNGVTLREHLLRISRQ
ncbi:hypothetical protein GCM10023085_74440 [Actinomadura viridis]|uniref:Uncharacterized protein n=1 Tax=Actinomadura viridis TaxID=58110 RepID=A0A931DEX9_9ACTN|nr:hypothetical protein [Actinomadura viridis]MBG6087564.1 hypothetical protein [Actinomadura viridis]